MKNAFLAGALVLFLAPAMAQSIQPMGDPTRPPGANFTGSRNADSAMDAAAADSTQIQGVVLRPDGRSTLIANGKTLRQGDRLGERKILRIAETGIVLADANGKREVIRLTPSVQKTPASGAKRP